MPTLLFNDIGAWLSAGFDAIPVIPPGVELHPRSKVDPKSRGKSPGVVAEGTDFWTGVAWIDRAQRVKLQRGELWAISAAVGSIGCATGPLILGLDIDSMDAALSAKLRDIAIATCGWAPTRTGQAPKCLLVYGAPSHEPEQPTRIFKWKKGSEEIGVEILGAGRQFVCSGIHPRTGQPYVWDTDPLAVGEAGLLAPLTSANIRAFIDAMKALMVAEGFVLGSTASSSGRHDGAPPPAAQLRAADMEVLRSAVEAIPNLPTTTREAYISIGVAIKAAAGPDREMDGYLAWSDWADRWEPEDPGRANTDETLQADWGRFKPPYFLGAEYIYDLAARHGWSKLPLLQAAFGADPLPAEELAKAEEEEARRAEHPVVLLDAGGKDAVLAAIGMAVAHSLNLFASPGGDLLAVRPTGRHREVPNVRLPPALPVQEIASDSDVWVASCGGATFFAERRGGRVRRDPPRELCRDYLRLRRGADARPLFGIAAAPIINDRGEIFAGDGYNPNTGLLHLPAPLSAVPASPTARDVNDAIATLKAPFKEFPFSKPEVDMAVTLGMVLSGVQRAVLPACPAFVVTSPTPGSGKGLLTSTASLISFGIEPVTFTAGPDAAELEKRLSSALLAGAPVLLIDNMNNATLEGPLLESLLTSEETVVRRLGASQTIKINSRALILANGNHLAVGGDMSRRALVITLDPACEQPELRAFDFDPRQTAREHRGDLLGAALTVLRAFRQAGKPTSGAPQLGSFETWVREVRDPLMWLGMCDITAAMRSAREADPRRAAQTAVLANLHARFAGDWFTASDIVGWARPMLNAFAGEATDASEAVATVLAPRSGRPLDSRSAGIWAAGIERTIFAGAQAGSRSGQPLQVEPISH